MKWISFFSYCYRIGPTRCVFCMWNGHMHLIYEQRALPSMEVRGIHADLNNNVKTPVTPEQKQRMECNRKAALERQKLFRQNKCLKLSQEVQVISKQEEATHSDVDAYVIDDEPQQCKNRKSSSWSFSYSDITLSKQQEHVLQAVARGHSVFITGSAGTGKTYLLMHVIRVLKKIYGPHAVFVTASTGVAACALNGQTIHSFSGVGLGTGRREFLLLKAAKNKQAAKRWRTAKALVIDEVSMIGGELFDNLEFIAREMRGGALKDNVWGGMQLIVSGDFFQLPPIDVPHPKKEFAFEADCWNESFHLQVELTRVFRQSDSQLIDLLQSVRKGHNSSDCLHLLTNLYSGPLMASERAASVTRLYPRNDDVRRLNNERLRSLGGEIVTYNAQDTGREPWRSQLKQGIAPDQLELSLGARVMLIKNIDTSIGLVNGSTGFVSGFVKQKIEDSGHDLFTLYSNKRLPKVCFDIGLERVVGPEKWDIMEGARVLATRVQVPLILAWALSIHKCQGMTLDRLHTDLSRAFDCGMVYVALSRVRSLNGLSLSGFDSSKIKAHPKVVKFYDALQGG